MRFLWHEGQARWSTSPLIFGRPISRFAPPTLLSGSPVSSTGSRRSAARGSQMLVLPEFACAQWLSFAPADLPPAGQLGMAGGSGQRGA